MYDDEQSQETGRAITETPGDDFRTITATDCQCGSLSVWFIQTSSKTAERSTRRIEFTVKKPGNNAAKYCNLL